LVRGILPSTHPRTYAEAFHLPETRYKNRLVVVRDFPSADPGSAAELPRLQALGWLFIKAYEPCSVGRDLQKFDISLQFTSLYLLMPPNPSSLGSSPISARRHLAYLPIVRSMNPVFVKPRTIKIQRLATPSLACLYGIRNQSPGTITATPFTALSRK
jgi:hypothetical protein